MIKRNLILTAFSAFILLLSSCGGGLATYDNEFLGELPSIDKNYNFKIEEKEKAIEECTDMEKAFKLSKELELLKDEKKATLKKYIEENPSDNEALPFEAIESAMCTTNKVVIDNIYTNGRIQFEFTLTVNNDVRSQRFTPFVYFKAVDNQDDEIVGTKTVAAGSRVKIEPGLIITAKGVLAAYRLENFAKIVQITKDEYNNKN